MDKLIDLINQGGTGEYDARQPQERGEAVAWQRFHYGQWVECTKEFYGQCVMLKATGAKSVYKVRALYTHPTPDSGRVAELEAQLAESREREGRMREALLRAQAWGGMGKGWDSSVALDLIDWINKGMTGPLPDLPDYLIKGAAEKEQTK